MRVLVIHQAFGSPGEPGGTRHWELGRYLAQSGDQMCVVTSQINYASSKRWRSGPGRFCEEANESGVRVLRVLGLPILNRSFTWRVVALVFFAVTSLWVAWRVRSVDVVMGTTPPIFQAVSAWLVAKLRRKPFLLEVRDLWPEFAIDIGVLRNPLLIFLSRWLERFLYSQADHILINSPAYRDYLEGRGIPSNKISLVPNGADVGMFRPDADGSAYRKALNLEDKFLVVYAGAMGMANDLVTILNAAARLRDHADVHFVLTGDGKERSTLRREAEELHLHNVTIASPVAKSKMPEVLAAADVCVATLKNIPMFTTTYPNKVFDYMAAGRPTVLAIDGVIRQVLERSEGGICVPPGNDEALADAVLQLYQAPALRARMGASARQYVITHFDRKQQAEEFRSILRRMAAREKVLRVDEHNHGS
jgi:glycosyltransferase involved in cell wall biosynthesis